jgi:signal transduction histidine kinase
VGKHLSLLDADHDGLVTHFHRALAGEAHSGTVARNGSSFELHWLPRHSASGAVVSVLGLAVDISEHARVEREMERARTAAEELAHLRSDFVASVSHELRTPLATVIGYSELLEAHWKRMPDAQRQDRVRRITLAAHRLQRLVEDLLLLSQLESRVLVPHSLPASVCQLARQAAEEVQTCYRGQRVDLHGPDQLDAQADPERTLQILVNLLDNAAKYSPEGSPVATVWQEEGRMVVVRVRDQGRGIAPEVQSHLFTRFGRVPGSRSRAGRVGTGLGLYLSRQLAEAMGGSLDLEATGPEGSTFRLALPLAPSRLTGDGREAACS